MLLPQKADTKGGTVSPRGTSLYGWAKAKARMRNDPVFPLLPCTQLGSDPLHQTPPVGALIHHLALAWGMDAAMLLG